MKNKATIIRVLFSLIISLYILGTIIDTFPGLHIILEIFIGLLIFLLINTATKFIPIGDIIAKL